MTTAKITEGVKALPRREQLEVALSVTDLLGLTEENQRIADRIAHERHFELASGAVTALSQSEVFDEVHKARQQ